MASRYSPSFPLRRAVAVIYCPYKLLGANQVNGRFPRQRDPRASSSLFDSYGGGSRPASRSPAPAGGYGYGGYSSPASSAYGNGSAGGSSYRSATPDKRYVGPGPVRCSSFLSEWANLSPRGHYSDAVLSSLESQNNAEVEGITAKVKMLKDVSTASNCCSYC